MTSPRIMGVWLIACCTMGGACASSSGESASRNEAGPGPGAATDAPSTATGDTAPEADALAPTGLDAGVDSSGPPGTDAATATDAPSAAIDATASDAPALTGTVKIMVLGSSNELGTCWRAYLWQKLRGQGITNFDFVGAENAGPDCGVAGYDKDTESRNGNRITSISAAQWTAMFRASAPDIVISHVGGADLLGNVPNPRIVEAFALSLAQARALNPRIQFLVGQHTPMEPASCANCRARVMDLNAKIAEWATQATTAASPVVAVDLFTGIDVVADTSDRVHLTNSGSQKVADKWLAVLAPLFKP